MREYKVEEKGKVKYKNLIARNMPLTSYKEAHKYLVIPCHDVFIKYKKGILLVTRDNYPAKGLIWPIGGRVKRGMHIEDSLKNKVKEECGLEIHDIKEIGCVRLYADTSPFRHGKGTDNISFVFFGLGKGKLKLDSLHKNHIIITREQYKKIKGLLHPFVRDFMDLAIKFI